MNRIIAVLVTLLALAIPTAASAAIVATPLNNDPLVPVQAGFPLATSFLNTGSAATVDFNANINYGAATVQVSDGSKCSSAFIKRGLGSRQRCKIPAGGEVLYTQGAMWWSYQPYTTHAAYAPPTATATSGTLLASVKYLTYDGPPPPTYTQPVNCLYKGWGYWVKPDSCP